MLRWARPEGQMSKLKGRGVKADKSSTVPVKFNNKEASKLLMISYRSESNSL